MDLNQALVQINVRTVVEMGGYVRTKVFLQFNKRVHNVQVVEKKLLIHVMIVVEGETNKLQKKYQ